MCAISWATTAYSSSRLSVSSRPSVTAMLAVAGSRPVAKALGSSSGTTQMRGRGTPEAMDISSTTLKSCLSSGVVGSRISHAPVDQRMRSDPLNQAQRQVAAANTVVMIPMNGTTGGEGCGGAAVGGGANAEG